MFKGQLVKVTSNRFHTPRDGVVAQCNKHGAIIDIPGIGSFFLQAKEINPNVPASVCYNMGLYHVT